MKRRLIQKENIINLINNFNKLPDKSPVMGEKSGESPAKRRRLVIGRGGH